MKKTVISIVLAVELFICLFCFDCNAYALEYSDWTAVPINSYDAFRNYVNGKAYDVDGLSGAQCVDAAKILWNRIGRNLSAGGKARGCWVNYKDSNAGNDFTLIYNIEDVKRGDVVVFEYLNTGHIAFADEDYDGRGKIWIFGQNQKDTRIWAYDSDGKPITEGPFTTCEQNTSTFLGAFRYKGWSSVAAIESGDYIIQSAIGNKFLSVENGTNQNGTNVQITTSDGSGAQIFHIGWNDYFRSNNIEMKGSGKFVDTEKNSQGIANIFLWEGTGAEGQNWYFSDAGDGYYYISNVWGYYLDVVNSENKDGTNVTTFSYTGGNNQKWRLVKVSGKKATNIPAGNYVIQSKIGNKYLDVKNGENSNGTNIQINSASSSSQAKQFYIGYSSAYSSNYIEFKGTGKFVDSDGNSRGITNVQLWEGTGAEGQNWYFEDAGDGYYYIRNIWGYYLDVVNSENKDGTNVTTYSYTGGDNQKWKLTSISTTQCAVNGYSISLDGRIGINFYLSISNDISNSIYATFSSSSEKIPIKSISPKNGANYCITAYIAPKDIDEVINLKIYSNDGDILMSDTVSLGKYIGAANPNNDEALANLLVRLQDYCYLSKQYFSGIKYSPQGDGYNDVSDLISNYPSSVNNNLSGIDYIGTSLVLESEISICHYFVVADEYSIDDFTISSDIAENVTVNGNICCVKLSNITALNMDEDYSVIIKDADDNYISVQYSVLSYIDKVICSDCDDYLAELSKSLYWYHYYSEQYILSVQ